MANRTKKADFATQYWRSFELLTSLLFEIDFKLERSEILITKMSRDGGRDVQIDKAFFSKVLNVPKIEIWVEAKLRGKNKQVMIRDIAGSVIMASNANIRSLYFVTNCYFTKQTVEELLLFGFKSGLHINLVNGYHYRNLLSTHFDDVLSKFGKENVEGITIPYFSSFMRELLDDLPTEPDKTNAEIEITIGKGTQLSKVEISGMVQREGSVELRQIRTSGIKSEHVLQLAQAKVHPVLTDADIAGNVKYQLIGKERQELFYDVLQYLYDGQIVIIKGQSGKGKSFFANHILRKTYQADYNVVTIDLSDASTLSVSKEIIGNLIGLNYFLLLENDEEIISHLSEYFQLEENVCRKVLEVIRRDRFTEYIAPEICLEVILKLVQSHQKRKKLLLLIDNLHKVSSDLMAFLKALFNRLRDIDIPVLGLTVASPAATDPYSETQWLMFIDSLSQSNSYQVFTLPELSNIDIEAYIKGSLPGANDNIISLIKKNTLNDAFYVDLYVDLLKQKAVILSDDQKYWWLNETSVLVDSSELQSRQINKLITEFLKIRLTDHSVRKFALLLFFFNNNLKRDEISSFGETVDYELLLKTGLFKLVYKDGAAMFTFYHDLYYTNFPALFPSEILALEASEYIMQSQKLGRADALGKLYEYSGDFEQAAECYQKYAKEQQFVSPFLALQYYERTLDVWHFPGGAQGSIVTKNNEALVEIIFKVFQLYDRYNFLASRKSPQLFQLLEKFDDFNQLNSVSKIQYRYFQGLKFTKNEDFQQAQTYLVDAYRIASSEPQLNKDILFKIICSRGVNLKHLGERNKSLEFFEAALKTWDSKQLRHEQYSNIAAYYLTSQPQLSLEYYQKMNKEYAYHINLHLLIDMAMANFYLKDLNESEALLHQALPLSRKRISLAEEARAENIFGVINWHRQNLELAEAYLDMAQSNSELANNQRWLWRIKANLAQIAYQNNHYSKSFNLCSAVAGHLIKTKEAVLFEAGNKSISSRRYAALKAIAYTLFRLDKTTALKELAVSLSYPDFDQFIKQMRLKGNVSFDDNDTNRFADHYYILG